MRPSKFVIFKYFLYILSLFDILEKVIRQKLTKHDAGEARDPSRKMRLESCCWNHGLTSTHDKF